MRALDHEVFEEGVEEEEIQLDATEILILMLLMILMILMLPMLLMMLLAKIYSWMLLRSQTGVRRREGSN